MSNSHRTYTLSVHRNSASVVFLGVKFMPWLWKKICRCCGPPLYSWIFPKKNIWGVYFHHLEIQKKGALVIPITASLIPGLVNCDKKLWKITMFHGKIHYFDWAIFNSFLYVYQRVSHEIPSSSGFIEGDSAVSSHAFHSNNAPITSPLRPKGSPYSRALERERMLELVEWDPMLHRIWRIWRHAFKECVNLAI